MPQKIQLRRETAANWTSANPTLLAAEVGFETDTRLFKIGDGSTAWNSLAYRGSVTETLNNKTLGASNTINGGSASSAGAAMRQRSDTAANWTSNNPTLGAAVVGLESDTGLAKVGDGSTAWNSLAYWTPGGGASSIPFRLNEYSAHYVPSSVTATQGTTIAAGAASAVDGSTRTSYTPASSFASLFDTFCQREVWGGTAAADRTGGCAWGGSIFRMPAATVDAQQRFSVTWAIADANPAGQQLVGVVGTAPTLTTSNQPSAITNFFGVGADNDMSQLVVMNNDASGVQTETTINGGSGFAANDATQVFKLDGALRSIGGVQSLWYRVRNLIGGADVTNTITTNMPANSQNLRICCLRGTGTGTAAPTVHVIRFALGNYCDF